MLSNIINLVSNVVLFFIFVKLIRLDIKAQNEIDDLKLIIAEKDTEIDDLMYKLAKLKNNID